jgi:hypothetical protein
MRLAIFFVLVMANLSMTVQGQNHFSLESASTIPGSTVDAIVRLENQSPVQGFQCAITWDSTLFSFSDTSTDGTDIEQILSPNSIEFFTYTNNAEIVLGTGWAACAAIFDFSPPFTGQTLEPSSGNSIVKFKLLSVADNALVGSCSAIELVNGFGQPPINNILTINGISDLPDLSHGEVCFTDSVPFIRGDANSDGTENLADAIFLISYFFSDGALPDCNSSADANTDLKVDIGDAIFLINYQFVNGTAPASPYPSCGGDPLGSGGLGCSNYNSCP